MNYSIHTPSAARFKKEIFDRVLEKMDANGKGIVTWQVAEMVGQLGGEGSISLKCPEGMIAGEVSLLGLLGGKNYDDDKIMLGRFIELLLVHLRYFIDKTVIE